MSESQAQTGGIDEIRRVRREKAEKLENLGWPSYPNGLSTSHQVGAVRDLDTEPPNEPTEDAEQYRLGGRIMAIRRFGKASFMDLVDSSGQIQIQLRKDILGEEEYQKSKLLDLGDIVVIEGPRFTTRRGELSIQVREITLATKNMYPLPDKHGGLSDVEQRYRQRYVDLIVNDEVKETFRKRSALIRYIRTFLDERGYMEVETPMLHSLIGGAAAKPFVTHHNALDMELYCRIAPELHLKRLVVGGFEKVYEIGRNFRNEGLSIQHNPEFTMLEFYTAWITYSELMDFTEDMFRGAALEVTGSMQVPYGEHVIDFEKPFRRLPVREGILEKIPNLDLQNADALVAAAKDKGLELEKTLPVGKLQMELFEHLWEAELIQPTFVTDFPIEVSPLARRKDSDPSLTDRFELYMTGRELANAFSELNDAEDQRSRFQAQMEAKAGGDEEAMDFDEDYCHALEIGMPPTAGEGIGIDRLAMVLTNSASIRDVILFPQMRKS